MSEMGFCIMRLIYAALHVKSYLFRTGRVEKKMWLYYAEILLNLYARFYNQYAPAINDTNLIMKKIIVPSVIIAASESD